MRTFLVLVAAVGLAGCGLHKIPGTDIDDTSETRAILDVVGKFRNAVESRNTQALIDLADESFRDDGGSASPDDDLEYKTLFTALPARFQRWDDVRLDLSVRRIELNPENTAARVTYSYTMSFRMPSLTQRTQSETDIKQMVLKRSGDKEWKIVSGI